MGMGLGVQCLVGGGGKGLVEVLVQSLIVGVDWIVQGCCQCGKIFGGNIYLIGLR